MTICILSYEFTNCDMMSVMQKLIAHCMRTSSTVFNLSRAFRVVMVLIKRKVGGDSTHGRKMESTGVSR